MRVWRRSFQKRDCGLRQEQACILRNGNEASMNKEKWMGNNQGQDDLLGSEMGHGKDFIFYAKDDGK